MLAFSGGAIVGQRAEQQDDIVMMRLNDGNHLFVLADGMGGHSGGREASARVCGAFEDFFQAVADIGNPVLSLRNALSVATASLAEACQLNPALDGLGSTVVALLINENSGQFHFLSVGDSPLYWWRNGVLTRLSADHSLKEDLRLEVEAGRMSADIAARHPARNVLKSAVTGGEIAMVDEKRGCLKPGDRLVLASDGVQTLDDSPEGRLAVLVGASDKPEEGVDRILKAVESCALPTQDNATIAIVAFAAGSEAREDARPSDSPPAPKLFRDNSTTNPIDRASDNAVASEPKRQPSRLLWAGLVLAAIVILTLGLFYF